jgi:lipopolysaccharide export system protein LptC
MALTSVKVDVFCNSTQYGQPSYRVYVDDELLTERSWIWPSYEVFIRENIEVELDSGVHEVKISAIGRNQVFRTENLTVNGNVVKITNSQKLAFTVE